MTYLLFYHRLSHLCAPGANEVMLSQVSVWLSVGW